MKKLEMKDYEIINTIIHSRKSVFPVNYIKKKIPKEIIEQILKNADRAPTHKFTEPWRFKVLRGEKKRQLGEFLAKKYKQISSVENFNSQKFDKIIINTQSADVIISIGMLRDPDESVPEWEEIAAVSMAVQNMHLSCTAYNIGAYWSSPKMINYMEEFCPMELGEKCLGFFYMGYFEKDLPISKRRPLDIKVDWL